MENVIQNLIEQLSLVAGGYTLNLLGAVVVLVLGWLIARVSGALVRGALKKTTLDNRLAEWMMAEKSSQQVDVEHWAGKTVFYIMMLFVLVAFFQVLNLTLITEPLNRVLIELAQFAPRLVGASVLLGLAWLIATGLRLAVSRAMAAARVDERLGGEAGLEAEQRPPLNKILADAIYWLVFLLFLPAVVGALQVGGLLAPVQRLTEQILGFLPNIFGAFLILAIGWFIARVVQRIVSNLLAALGADRVSERLGVPPATFRLSRFAGVVTYGLILIPVVIAALNALQLEAITRPASQMLGRILDAVPALLAAALVLALAYAVGRWAAGIVSRLLSGAGFNQILVRLGLARAEPAEGKRTPSEVVGYLLVVGVMLFASMEAARLLGFTAVAESLLGFTVFVARVLLGLVIFAVGLFLANVAGLAVSSSSATQAPLMATAARVAIIVLAGAMALREMGLANEIIELAFGLLLGSIAVAVALAFGLGSRDIAARHVESWLESAKLRSGKRSSSSSS